MNAWWRRILAAGLVVGCAWPVAPGAEKLVPANFSNKTDGLGFNWDLDQSGRIGDGSSDCYDGAQVLQVAGSGIQHWAFNGSQAMMVPDGSEYVLSHRNGQLSVTRRIKLLPKVALLRYVEILENHGSSKLTVNLVLQSDMGAGVDAVGWDTQQPIGMNNQPVSMPEKAWGFRVNQGQGRPQVVQLLGRTKKRLPITARVRSDDVWVTYQFEIPARKTVAILHYVGQRQPGQTIDPKTRKHLFRRRAVRDLPAKVRRALINLPGHIGDFAQLLDIAKLEVPRLEVDALAVGAETILRGHAEWDSGVLTTRFGELSIPFADVAALVGRTRGGENQICFLRDGRVLRGTLDTTGFGFELESGFQVLRQVHRVDRLVAGGLPETGPYPTGWSLTTVDGMRLGISESGKLAFDLYSPWGAITLPAYEIRFLRRLPGEATGAWLLETQAGSRLPVFPAFSTLELTTVGFGPVRLVPGEVASIDSPEAWQEREIVDRPPPGRCRLLLPREYTVTGTLETERLHLSSENEDLHLPVRQIARLQQDEENQLSILLWDGGRAGGRWLDREIRIQVGDTALHIDTPSVLELSAARPRLKPVQRARVLKLVAQLGADDWKERDRATKELASMGESISSLLREQLQEIRDPEVRHRIDLLLRGREQ